MDDRQDLGIQDRMSLLDNKLHLTSWVLSLLGPCPNQREDRNIIEWILSTQPLGR